MPEDIPPPFDRPDAHFNTLEGWSWVGTYGGWFLQADLLNGFEHGFFTRQWQGREPDELAGYLSAGVSVHRPRQIHSALVLLAHEAPAPPWPEADGLVSSAGGQSLWVCGADCTPVLMADPRTGRVAACHAGWRGVAGRILPRALAAMEAAGSRREDVLVAMGPAVSGAAYQVEPEVSQQVAESLFPSTPSHAGGSGAREALIDCGALAADPNPGRDRLDIRAASKRQLEHEGIPPEQIALCPLCTVGQPSLFHSWRRDQVKAVQWSGIVAQG
ncbi:MAG: peptidoglycan editing factor PgeF [Cyanobacteriota bacterium]|nr:peptidoglycan editing factor PgeF [Cyanobacteriota bacterium]